MAVRPQRVVTWGIAACVVVAALAYAFWPRPVPVDLATVKRGSLVITADEEGQTRIKDIFVVSSPIAGRIRRIEKDVGDAVIAGKTIVAYVEPSDPAFLDVRSEAEAEADVKAAEAAKSLADAKLAEAKAELDFARSELARAQRLIQSKVIAERALDEARRAFKTKTAMVATAVAEVRVRESELARARARLVSPVEVQSQHGSCKCIPVPAPVSGSILRLAKESEGVVQAGETLMEIGDPRDLEIVVDFLSTDAVRIEPGQRVIIDEWGGEGTLAGRVRRVEPYGFTKVSALGVEEQRVNVIIDFVDPPARWSRLGHGFRVEVRVVLWEGVNVLKLPVTALFRAGHQWGVFVEKDGRARRRIVSVGRRNGFEAEVIRGMEEGERVITYPSDRITDGLRIEARG